MKVKEYRVEMLEEMSLLSFEINNEDLNFWSNFTSSSYHVALDHVKGNRDLQSKELALFKGLQEILELSDVEGMSIPITVNFSYSNMVLIHENMDMYLDVLLVNGKEKEVNVCEKYIERLERHFNDDVTVYETGLTHLHI